MKFFPLKYSFAAPWILLSYTAAPFAPTPGTALLLDAPADKKGWKTLIQYLKTN
jgi:hypothetical protein